MKQATLLLRPKLLSIKNTVSVPYFLRRVPFFLIGIGVWAAMFFGTWHLLVFVRNIHLIGDILVMRMLSMTFFGLFGFLFLSNLITSFSAFYLSHDLSLLMTKPVKTEMLLLGKSVEAITNSSWMVVLFILPIVIAYGVVYEAPFLYYLSFPVFFLPFLLIPAGLGITLCHILARMFSARKMRMAAMGVSLLLFIALYMVIQQKAAGRPDSIEELISALLRLNVDIPLLPSYWMHEAMSPFLIQGKMDLLFPFLLITNGAFFLLIAFYSGSRWYLQNLFAMHDRGGKGAQAKGKTFPVRARAFYWKDMKTFFRDPEQWSQLVIIGALLMVYLFNFRVLPVSSFAEITPFYQEAAILLNTVLAGLVLTAVSARFLYVAVSLEGGAIWILKAVPFSLKTFLWNKYLYGFIPVTIILLALVLVSIVLMKLPGSLIVLSLATVLLLCISVCGLAVGMGAAYPRFRYENIGSVAMGMGSVTFMVLAFFLVLVTIALEGWALFVYKRAVFSGLSLTVKDYLIMGLAIGTALGLNSLAILLPIRAGIRRLGQETG